MYLLQSLFLKSFFFFFCCWTDLWVADNEIWFNGISHRVLSCVPSTSTDNRPDFSALVMHTKRHTKKAFSKTSKPQPQGSNRSTEGLVLHCLPFQEQKVFLPCSLPLQTPTGGRYRQRVSWGGRWSPWWLGRLPPWNSESRPSLCLCSRARRVHHLPGCGPAALGSSSQWSKNLPSFLRIQRQVRVRLGCDPL